MAPMYKIYNAGNLGMTKRSHKENLPLSEKGKEIKIRDMVDGLHVPI
jgi:hypothetical protein